MSRVTLTNPFDLLTDENEDRTNVPAPKKEQKPAASAKPAAKPAAPAAAKPAPKPEGAKAPAKPAEAKPAVSKPPTGNSAPQTVKPAPPRDANTNLQERDKETRAPRDKRDRPPTQKVGDGKRPFDRKSGTGRPKNEVTRGGHGKGNWGEAVDTKEGVEALKDKEEKPVEEKEEGDETKEEKPAAEGEKKEGEPAKEGAAATETAPAKEEMTYDEYLKSRKSKAPPVEAPKPRTVTDTDFGGFVPLQREENGGAAPAGKKKEKKEKPAGEKKEKPAPEKKEAEKKTENLAAKLLTFASHQDVKRQERGPYRNYDDRRGGASSGERRGRGERPRGPRPDHAKQGNTATQPPVQEKDFPALGPHGSDPVKA